MAKPDLSFSLTKPEEYISISPAHPTSDHTQPVRHPARLRTQEPKLLPPKPLTALPPRLPLSHHVTTQAPHQERKPRTRPKPLRIPVPVIVATQPTKPSPKRATWWETFFEEYAGTNRISSRRRSLTGNAYKSSRSVTMKSPRRSPRAVSGHVDKQTLRTSKASWVEHHRNLTECKKRAGSMDSVVDYKAVLDIKRLGEAVEEAMPSPDGGSSTAEKLLLEAEANSNEESL